MGEWQNVAFARGSVEAVREALVHALAAEGRALVERPAPRKPGRGDPMQYADGDGAPTWGIAIAPGAEGWCIVKTAPFELLCEKRGALMARLAKKLRAEVFQINLYDGIGLTLLEANAKGKLQATGFAIGDHEPMSWSGFTMTEEQCTARFGQVRVPAEVREALAGVSSVDAMECVARTFGGDNAAFTGNETNVRTLVAHEPPEGGDVVVLFFRRADDAPAPREPLRIEVTQQTFGDVPEAAKPEPWGAWPDRARLVLRAGGGEVWLDGHWLVAPDPTKGKRLLDAIAQWLGVAAPSIPAIPALLEPLYCSLEKDGDALSMRLGEREAVTLRLEGGALHETETRLRERAVDLLSPALAGPWRPRKEPIAIPTWHPFTEEPVRITSGAGFAGDTLVGGGWRGDHGVVLASDAPGAPARDIATFEDLVSTVVPAPDARFAAACVVHSERTGRLRGIGSDDDASVVLVDLSNGHQRVVMREVDPFTSLLWSPNGEHLAVTRDRRTLAIDRDGKVLFTSEADWESAGWDDDGLLLVKRDYRTSGPPTWSRWRRGEPHAVPAEERYASPGSRFHVTPREKEIVIESEGRVRTISARGIDVTSWRTPPVWLGDDAFVSLGDIPRIVSLSGDRIVRLAPAAKDLRPCAATTSRVAAFHREGRLFWGVVT